MPTLFRAYSSYASLIPATRDGANIAIMKKYGNAGGGTTARNSTVKGADCLGHSQTALLQLLEKGAEAYRRDRHLPGLIPCWPEQILDISPGGTAEIIERIRRVLRAERVRGKAGHWTYDLNRHIALAIALKAESAQLAAMSEDAPTGPIGPGPALRERSTAAGKGKKTSTPGRCRLGNKARLRAGTS